MPDPHHPDRKICQYGVHLLKGEKHYTQNTIIQKMKHLGKDISRSSFSEILGGKKEVSGKRLQVAAEGICAIILSELGMEWQDGNFMETTGENFNAEIIPTAEEAAAKPDFKFHEHGRLPIAEKIEFFRSAQKEVIEFGVTLNTFTSYFFSRSDHEFKIHVAELLERGVNFKCFLLDPKYQPGNAYFEDREPTQKGEKHYVQKINRVTEKLAKVQAEFAAAGLRGRFEVFTYRHVPYNYIMAIDGDTPQCTMMVSHYLYGLPRAKAPVLEFSRNHSPSLAIRYWDSLRALTKNAKKVVPSE